MKTIWIEDLMVWNIYVLKLFKVAESIRFKIIEESINSKLINKKDPETIRVFLNNMVKDGYLEKFNVRGETVYMRTEKFKILDQNRQKYITQGYY